MSASLKATVQPSTLNCYFSLDNVQEDVVPFTSMFRHLEIC